MNKFVKSSLVLVALLTMACGSQSTEQSDVVNNVENDAVITKHSQGENCCQQFPECDLGDWIVSGPTQCINGGHCYRRKVCCSTIWCTGNR